MTDGKPPSPALRELLRELAAADAPALLERARCRAASRAERLIEDALVTELLEAAARTRTRTGSGRDEGRSEVAADESVEGEAWWAYCVMWDQDAPAVASGPEGVEVGSEVEAICDGQLAALVSRVPLPEYGDERLREHLEDLDWVGRTARRHEAVLEAALGETTIVPLRLCTLYRERDGVRRLLHDQRSLFREGLARVDGCLEWGVKLFADGRPRAADPAPEPGGAESRGATYLLRRRRERALAEEAGEVRARCVEIVHQRLAGLSRESALNPPQRPEVHGRELSMLLNGVYLVERGRSEEIQDAVAGLKEEWAPLGFAIELTGPWPPYNFVAGTEGVIS